ncbi:MAG: hypothetical protein ACOY3K_03570 [Candidatus Omnitrophota bacterium]
MQFLEKLALFASIALPFFNLPLVVQIIKRRSSRDISLVWAAGVWGCLLGMLPSALVSGEAVWKVFGIFNFIFFSAVFFVVIYYRRGNSKLP